MKVISFISTNEWARWGGSELLWSQAAERFARLGAEVRISTPKWEPPVPDIARLESLGCRLFLRGLPTIVERVRHRVVRGHQYLAEHARRVGAGAELVVVSQGINIDALPWLEAAQAHGYKYAIVVQAAADYAWPGDDLAEKLAACYEGARGTYFVSTGNLELTRRQFVTPLHKAKVIRNPFNVRYDAAPMWPEDAETGLSLGCVARLDGGTKGHDLLFQVLALPHWRARNVRVSLIGSGHCGRGIQRLAKELGLAGVEFLGHVSDIESVWRRHQALILPSRHEGMPLVVVEAMLCGRACIATDVGGNRELIRDGVNGFLAKAPTVEFVDEAMNRAWENRHRLREMGEQAAIDVRKWVSADPVGDFVRELESLTNGKRT